MMTELLIKYGATINIQNKKGGKKIIINNMNIYFFKDSPLDWALYDDNLKVARLLLLHGARITFPLKETKMNDYNSVAKLLITTYSNIK